MIKSIMKNLRKNLKLIMTFVIMMIIVSGISVYATTQYFATQINYTKSDGSVVTVANALNELYSQNNSAGATEFIGQYRTESTAKNNKTAAITINNLTVGEHYFMVIFRLATGGTNAVISSPSMEGTTFSNMTYDLISDENTKIVYKFVPTDTSVTITFGTNTSGSSYGGYCHAIVFKGSLQ